MEGVNLIHVYQNRYERRALVNTVKNFLAPVKREISWVAKRLLASQGQIYYID
jgi:hypothetical protein